MIYLSATAFAWSFAASLAIVFGVKDIVISTAIICATINASVAILIAELRVDEDEEDYDQ